uniref:Uncharacterized protein n=1 Tax=Branchiostoma floridae TaxID=7739 RepID=C3ZZB4_BRAFL|eukprot:XP_002586107.1 hypothetical protein BRAFLDRAFT_110009 [Branchiostoma floridae]
MLRGIRLKPTTELRLEVSWGYLIGTAVRVYVYHSLNSPNNVRWGNVCLVDLSAAEQIRESNEEEQRRYNRPFSSSTATNSGQNHSFRPQQGSSLGCYTVAPKDTSTKIARSSGRTGSSLVAYHLPPGATIYHPLSQAVTVDVEVTSGVAGEQLEAFTFTCSKIAQLTASPEKVGAKYDELVSAFKNTMEDDAGSQKRFNQIVKEYRQEILPDVHENWETDHTATGQSDGHFMDIVGKLRPSFLTFHKATESTPADKFHKKQKKWHQEALKIIFKKWSRKTLTSHPQRLDSSSQLSIIIDRMDQDKTSIPHFVLKTKVKPGQLVAVAYGPRPCFFHVGSILGANTDDKREEFEKSKTLILIPTCVITVDISMISHPHSWSVVRTSLTETCPSLQSLSAINQGNLAIRLRAAMVDEWLNNEDIRARHWFPPAGFGGQPLADRRDQSFDPRRDMPSEPRRVWRAARGVQILEPIDIVCRIRPRKMCRELARHHQQEFVMAVSILDPVQNPIPPGEWLKKDDKNRDKLNNLRVVESTGVWKVLDTVDRASKPYQLKQPLRRNTVDHPTQVTFNNTQRKMQRQKTVDYPPQVTFNNTQRKMQRQKTVDHPTQVTFNNTQRKMHRRKTVDHPTQVTFNNTQRKMQWRKTVDHPTQVTFNDTQRKMHRRKTVDHPTQVTFNNSQRKMHWLNTLAHPTR